ncbi:receptor-like protein EIX2 [Benincasa hispida]|uniref:receptor-like protein EIX2 n=1 Tax=Benincasa hispida TaxID=102211 RepID=UPI0018FF3FDF|nr:receptor-like protein EIX2 [Benincasa hispida]
MGRNSTNLVALFFIVIIFLSSFWVSSASCIKQERESLLRLKASFVDSSNRLVSWKGNDCCSWEGVGCDHTNGGHVIKLDLRNYEYSYSTSLLSNGVDSSLFELKYLNYLDLSGNSFNYTQTPLYLTELLELTYLNLSLTYFHGEISRSLGNLTKLVVLDFNIFKSLDGPGYFHWTELFIDGLEWVSSLSSLEYLDLSGIRVVQSNLVVDVMQVLNILPSLSSLKLSNCGLQNTLHIYAPQNASFLSKLQHLDLSYNMFDGPIPSFLRNMTSLRFLSLHSNRYNSSIPSWLSNLVNFDTLDLGFNMFSSIEGGLSSIVRNNCHLKTLHLSFNHFLGEDIFGSYENLSTNCKQYGLEELYLNMMIKFGTHTIPNWLGELQNLKFLYLQNNSLRGSIPSSFGNLSSLEKLDISYNMLNGGFPISFGKLSNLMLLNLRENNLDGVFLESFGQLQNLILLDLSHNDFKGALSEIHFANISRLEYLFMDENELLSFEMKSSWVPAFQLKIFSIGSTLGFGTTKFPRWIGTQKEMSYLNLFNCNIVGPIPTWFKFQNLIFLDLSYNQITRSLPKSIDDQMPNLTGLLISNAHINGSLPQSLCRLKNLELLIVSNNRLSNTIPSCLSILNLNLLDLSSNNLLGVFPSSFQNLSNLEVMNLARNQLQGEPLMAMRSFNFLSILDLEGNKFCGNIPEWMGKNLQNLQLLNLRGNMFNDTIPSTLWLLPRLQILILADNKLVGNIPPNVGNFSASRRPIANNDGLLCNSTEDPYAFCYMSYITQVMKSSKFNYSYSQLYLIVNIDLSNNNLHGHIPSEIVAINGLFALNLSHNNLSGIIPVEIGSSIALESLDLSFNQLSGSIPNSMASLNSLGTLKLSNNNFSGCIPREGHLSTFNDVSSYENNPNLCGAPLAVICPNENPKESSVEIDNVYDNDSHEEHKLEKMWFWIIVVLGYALGFWAVVGTLILKRSWRYAYFQFMDETKDKICVAILVNMTTLKQQMGGNVHRCVL